MLVFMLRFLLVLTDNVEFAPTRSGLAKTDIAAGRLRRERCRPPRCGAARRAILRPGAQSARRPRPITAVQESCPGARATERARSRRRNCHDRAPSPGARAPKALNPDRRAPRWPRSALRDTRCRRIQRLRRA